MKRNLALVLLALSLSLSAGTLPPESAALLQKLKEFETAEQAKANQAIQEKRAAVAKTLQAQLEAETKKGNLDGALEIKNAIAEIQPKSAPEKPDPSAAAAKPKIPENAYRGRKAFYLIVTAPKPVSWTFANAECEKMGGKLASAEDMRDLTKYVESQKAKSETERLFWVGGRKSAEDGKLRWLNGAQIDMDRFRWAGNKERMTRDEFQYVAMGANGALLLENDRGFDRYAAFICEWPR